ncbi:MAG: D-alanyl-D-alanine carboxypeptidase/D-alanyl-D-alanine-endopeptidase [Fibromonadaceae bacterium]|jgi:D-alanyl-D-alanine carboxypeptidase/D-alanyl-D-alanine-endopeptidase (penicillin-binding protein 4)|nr:D-alanyl-D-alanine carboxypeptidase/D-alanyl-D-alanine-endopeptidase [Fibromonadaceae bacterium]
MRFLLLFLLLAGASFASNPFLDSLVAYADSLAPTAKLGISLRSVKTDSLVYSHNGNDWFVPASTMKLLTTAAAVQSIPLNYAPKTLVHLEGIKRGNVFSGALRLEGRGDPNISARYYPNALFVLDSLTESLKARGIDTIRGILDLDTSFFKGPRKPRAWRQRFFDAWYGAEISPLAFNDNCVLIEIRPGAKDGDSALITIIPDIGYVKVKNDITTGGRRANHKHAMDPEKPEISFTGTIGARVQLSTVVLPVRNPARYFEAAFLRSLENKGIIFIRETAVYRKKATDSIVFTGPPLRSIMDEVNQRSQNMHAEVLLRTLGQLDRYDGSVESGILSTRVFLHNAGLPEADFKMADGSGLSHQNSLKPNALTQLLTYMKKQPKGNVYYSSLAIPGISGGGKRVDIEYKNKVRFKTGFIEGTHGLAGYIAADGDTLAFAFYFNNAQKVTESLARDIIDTITGRIAKHYNSSEESALEEGKRLWNSGREIRNTNARINHFSDRLKGKPYLLGPMGEGISVFPSFKPRVHFKEMDCVTYMEHALALAYARNYDDFFNILQSIRYKNGVIDYKTRNHFLVVDWIANNKFKMNMEQEVFEKEIYKRRFFKDSSLVNPKISIPFLPKDKAITFADTVRFAQDTVFGVAILSELPGLDAAHTGFIVGSRNKPLMLRHASQLRGRVIEQPLSEFLKTTKIKTPGVAFFRFDDD